MAEKFKGRAKKGEVRNPKGRPAGNQNYIDRVCFLLNHYTVGDIIDLVEGFNSKDPARKRRTRQLSAQDGLIIMQIAQGYQRDGGEQFNLLLDRLYGKPGMAIPRMPQHLPAQINDETLQGGDGTGKRETISATLEWARSITGGGQAG